MQSIKFCFIALSVAVVINVVVLDVFVLTKNKKTSIEKDGTDKSIGTPLPTPTESISNQVLPTINKCPASCLSYIYEATASFKLSQPSPIPNNVASTAREFFVPFGSGSNATDDWTDVAGLQAQIDSTQYGRIKSATFEATIHIPTGNETAYARLFNVTDKHPVWFSDVSVEGGKSQLVVSKPITLDSGSKLYQVQMKTSLKFPADLVQARLHITTY